MTTDHVDGPNGLFQFQLIPLSRQHVNNQAILFFAWEFQPGISPLHQALWRIVVMFY